jgi:hypothetical protein
MQRYSFIEHGLKWHHSRIPALRSGVTVLAIVNSHELQLSGQYSTMIDCRRSTTPARRVRS